MAPKKKGMSAAAAPSVKRLKKQRTEKEATDKCCHTLECHDGMTQEQIYVFIALA